MTYAVAGGPSWSYIGIFGIVTAAWGLCPIYAYFGIRTLKDKQRAILEE